MLQVDPIQSYRKTPFRKHRGDTLRKDQVGRLYLGFLTVAHDILYFEIKDSELWLLV